LGVWIWGFRVEGVLTGKGATPTTHVSMFFAWRALRLRVTECLVKIRGERLEGAGFLGCGVYGVGSGVQGSGFGA
jgi:hypothetical protein